MMLPTKYDEATTAVSASIPAGVRVAVIGSTSFWHHESEETCVEIGQGLAALERMVLLTGGVSGVGECIGRGFVEGCRKLGRAPNVFHVLPRGCSAWDYGTTLFAGDSMGERREILGRLAKVFIVVEGGPGSEHEAAVAMTHGAVLVPVGRSGGVAGTLYHGPLKPPSVDARAWESLGDSGAAPRKVGRAVVEIIQSCLRHGL
jgi:hypothetical protein